MSTPFKRSVHWYGVLFILKSMAFFIVFHSVLLPAPNLIYAGETEGWQVWNETYWPTPPVRGGMARAAAPVYIGLMNPNHFPVLDWISMSYMYEKLIYVDGQNRPTIPWLATSWEFIDEVTVRMHLRQGVLFSDGTPFNADSLIYQMNWILDENNNAWTRSWLKPLKSVEKLDQYTVKWHFNQPWGSFLGTMASVPGYMISKNALLGDKAITDLKETRLHILSLKRRIAKIKAQSSRNNNAKKVETAQQALDALLEKKKHLEKIVSTAQSLDSHPVGTGQYRLAKASHGNYIQLKRNSAWWFGKSINHPEMPYFDGIRVSVIPDPSVRLANLKAGQLDFILLNPRQYLLAQRDPKLNVSIYPTNWIIYLTLNHAKGACQSLNVRKAISHAIDRKALIVGTQFGQARMASCLFPDDHWAHNPTLKPVSYDPERSKKLLQNAGYTNGLKLKGFALNIPETQTVAKAIMAMLDKVGMTWKPVFMGITGMAEPFARLDFDLIVTVYPYIQDPDHAVTLIYHPDSFMNNGRTHNPQVVELIEKGRHTVNETQRRQIYHDLEKTLYENYEDVWLFYPNAIFAMNKNLQGFNAALYKQYGEGYIFSHPNWFKDGHP